MHNKRSGLRQHCLVSYTIQPLSHFLSFFISLFPHINNSFLLPFFSLLFSFFFIYFITPFFSFLSLLPSFHSSLTVSPSLPQPTNCLSVAWLIHHTPFSLSYCTPHHYIIQTLVLHTTQLHHSDSRTAHHTITPLSLLYCTPHHYTTQPLVLHTTHIRSSTVLLSHMYIYVQGFTQREFQIMTQRTCLWKRISLNWLNAYVGLT